MSRAAPRKTVTVTIPVGADGGSANIVGASLGEFCQRGLIAFPGDVYAMRLKVRNHRTVANTDNAGAIDITGLWMANPKLSVSMPPWDGEFMEPGLLVIPAFATPAGGTEVVTPWVTDLSVLPKKGVVRGWSLGIKAQGASTPFASSSYAGYLLGMGGGSIAAGMSLAASAGGALRPKGVTGSQNLQILDVRMEVVLPEMPVVIGIGDSITAGSSANNLGLFPHEGHIGRAGIQHGFMGVPMGNGGASATNWATADPLTNHTWQRIDWKTSPPRAVIVALGINDIQNLSRTDVQVQGDLQTVVANIRVLAPDTQVYLATITPASLTAGGTPEGYRNTVNNWIRGLPLGAVGCLDFDRALSPIPQTSGAVFGEALYMTSGDLHPKRPGYTAMANVIPSFGGLNT